MDVCAAGEAEGRKEGGEWKGKAVEVGPAGLDGKKDDGAERGAALARAASTKGGGEASAGADGVRGRGGFGLGGWGRRGCSVGSYRTGGIGAVFR
ncbi:MAG: hypothetical protein KF768_01495 [Phycisphaeraceae bacterium]|nr:hypothetical protein [Phycisphaeraceae bacterium]